MKFNKLAGLCILAVVGLSNSAHANDVSHIRPVTSSYHQTYPAGAGSLDKDFPFLSLATSQYAFGEVWERTVLDEKTKHLAAVAAYAAVGRDAYPQMQLHARLALQEGVSVEELKEIIYLTTVTAGFPKALNASIALKDVIGAQQDAIPVAAKSPDNLLKNSDRRENGLQVMADLSQKPKFAVNDHPVLRQLEKDYPFLISATVDYSLGDVWGRTVLSPATRQLAAIAAFATIGGDAWPQMKVHARYALQMGVPAEQLKEIIYMVTVTGGFPKALNGAAQLNALLEEYAVSR